jgi:hypothetical protein
LEGADAFHAILGMKTFELVFDLALKGLRQSVIVAAEERAFDGADGDLRTGSNFLSEGTDFILKAVKRKNVV